ncbi:hypothetical protein Tco_1525884 [Tanacetum coccineum]
MIIGFYEITQASVDGTLQQIDEALDYRVKEFQINRTNPGINTRFWMKKDVDRSKDFMFAILKQLKTRRIFRYLPRALMGGRIPEDRPTHYFRSSPHGPEDQAHKMEMEDTSFQWSQFSSHDASQLRLPSRIIMTTE